MAMIIGTQAYTWHQYCEGEGKKLADELDRVLGEVAAAGLKAWEGTISHEAEADQHAALLEKHGLSMPSMYTGARLHDPEWRAAADEVVARGRLAKRAGTRWLVVNPDPLRWGAKEDKTDDQLRRQAEALRYIGRALDEQGQMLVYHAHDMEMRNAAREFHHMLRSTADLPVGWCLDAHWAFRGAGNSNVALQDLLGMYGDRVATLHLRQSHNGIWSELLEEGDVDHEPIFELLRRIHFAGPAMLEICSEKGTPRTLPHAEAHRRSARWFTERLQAAGPDSESPGTTAGAAR